MAQRFKRGDLVTLPSGRPGTVLRVHGGESGVEVQYDIRYEDGPIGRDATVRLRADMPGIVAREIKCPTVQTFAPNASGRRVH